LDDNNKTGIAIAQLQSSVHTSQICYIDLRIVLVLVQ